VIVAQVRVENAGTKAAEPLEAQTSTRMTIEEKVREALSGRPARHDQEQQRGRRSDHAPAGRSTSAWNARTRHRPALVDEPVRDEKDEGDAQEDLVTVLGADSTIGGRHRRVDRAQGIAEALRRRFAVVTEIASVPGGGEILKTRLVEPARDLRAVLVDEHLLELTLHVVERDRAALGGADAQREDMDPSPKVGIEGRQIRLGILSVRDDHDRLRTRAIRHGGRELRGGALERGAER